MPFIECVSVFINCVAFKSTASRDRNQRCRSGFPVGSSRNDPRKDLWEMAT